MLTGRRISTVFLRVLACAATAALAATHAAAVTPAPSTSTAVTWSISVNNTGATIDAATGLYQPTGKAGIDTIRAVDANGVVGTITYETLPVAIHAAAMSMHECSSLLLTGSGGSNGFTSGGLNGYNWQVVSGPANFRGNAGATAANPGIATGHAPTLYSNDVPGRVEVAAADTKQPANRASVFVDVLAPPYLELVGVTQGGGVVRYSASLTSFLNNGCSGKATIAQPLQVDVTRRDSVAAGQAKRYSAAVTTGQVYVVSLAGIVGGAQLAVFNDNQVTQPVACIAPNLANSTTHQPADCSFAATVGTVYVTVSGAGATTSNYNLRISPRFAAAAATQGSKDSPMAIVPDKPFGGTAGPNWSDLSYYVVNTGGAGDVVVSLTGQTGAEWLDLSLYDNPGFNGKLNNADCFFGEPGTFAESCILPAGKTYYLTVFTGKVGGPFTLMVDSPAGAVAPPAAAPPAAAPNVINQGLPASTTAP